MSRQGDSNRQVRQPVLTLVAHFFFRAPAVVPGGEGVPWTVGAAVTALAMSSVHVAGMLSRPKFGAHPFFVLDLEGSMGVYVAGDRRE